MTVPQWSTTASSNNSAPPAGAPEGQTPGSLNNCIREVMASVALEAQVNAVKVLGTVSGTNTVTGVMTPALGAYSAGMFVVFTPANTNTSAVTLNINELGALDVQKFDGEALIAGDLVAGVPALALLDSGADDFILLNPQLPQVSSSSAAEFGFKGLPQNSQTANYTAVLTDAGGHIKMNNTTLTFTIPANASVAYPLGTVLTVANRHTTDLTIAITSDTLILAGTSSTGSRTLASNGLATALKTNTAEWMISGTGLS